MEAEHAFPPAWFDIANYRRAKEFGPLQWYEQLSRRQLLLLPDYVLGQPLTGSLEDEVWRTETAKNAAHIRQSPLQDMPALGLARPEPEPVSDLRVIHLMEQADRDREARKFGLCDGFSTQRWRVIRNPQASQEDHAKLSQTPITMDFYDIRKAPMAVIQVDMGASNAVLREAFERWLQAARKAELEQADPAVELAEKPGARNVQDRTQRPPCDRWAKYQLLPYIDLAIWAMETGAEVTWPMYAEALWDNHYRTHEDIRKTTHLKYAMPLMRDLSKLRAYVGYSLQEN